VDFRGEQDFLPPSLQPEGSQKQQKNKWILGENKIFTSIPAA